MLLNFQKNSTTKKNIIYSLSSIYGINKSVSKQICFHLGINPAVKLSALKKHKIESLTNFLKTNFKTGRNLKNHTISIKKNLLEIKSYRGLRNWFGLPVHGQRTSTNGKTKKKYKYKN